MVRRRLCSIVLATILLSCLSEAQDELSPSARLFFPSTCDDFVQGVATEAAGNVLATQINNFISSLFGRKRRSPLLERIVRSALPQDEAEPSTRFFCNNRGGSGGGGGLGNIFGGSSGSSGSGGGLGSLFGGGGSSGSSGSSSGGGTLASLFGGNSGNSGSSGGGLGGLFGNTNSNSNSGGGGFFSSLLGLRSSTTSDDNSDSAST